MKYVGYVAVPEKAIELWRTQIWRSYQKCMAQWPDAYGGKTYTQKQIGTHGASGVWRFCQKQIREQLKIPHSEVIYKVHQRRLVKKIGNVWWMKVETRPRKK